jgi:hypothetical protein
MTALQSEKLKKEKSTAKLFYAIMEIEAWVLGMSDVPERLDVRLKADAINKSLGFDLNKIDPETTFFHPARILNDIYHIAGLSYEKQKADIEVLAKVLICEDYDKLYRSEKCNAFKSFYEELNS